MPFGPVGELIADLLNGLLKSRRGEFLSFTATGADKMSMLAFIETPFEPGPAIAEINLAGNTALGKQAEGTIDGRETDPGVLFTNDIMQLVRRNMFSGRQEGVENDISLGGLFQSLVFKVAVEYFVFFSHNFPFLIPSTFIIGFWFHSVHLVSHELILRLIIKVLYKFTYVKYIYVFFFTIFVQNMGLLSE